MYIVLSFEFLEDPIVEIYIFQGLLSCYFQGEGIKKIVKIAVQCIVRQSVDVRLRQV